MSKKKKRACFIICYFGKFPDYYKLWEKTAANNSNYDFLIFTDQEYDSNYENIIIYKKSLEEMNKLFSEKLQMNICIKIPYKFCDFRPSFGVIFDDYIKKYDFWGHCDFDQIFGNIDSFLDDEVLSNYERINHLGHFCLYKNNSIINNLFKKNGSPFNYKEVFTSDNNYAFDEISGIDMIVKKNNIKSYEIKSFADIDVKHERYIVNHFPNYEHQYFVYEDGKLYFEYYHENKKLKTELMYLHFQKKHPILYIDNYDEKIFIGCKYFSNKYSENINGKKITIFEFLENIKYFWIKIISFLKASLSVKKIWIKQKGKKLWKI